MGRKKRQERLNEILLKHKREQFTKHVMQGVTFASGDRFRTPMDRIRRDKGIEHPLRFIERKEGDNGEDK